MLKLIDSHCHLNFEGFKNDRDQILQQSLDADIGVINIGSQFETSREAVNLANKYKEGVWASVGLHPIHIGKRIRDEMETEFQEEIDTKSDEEILKKIKNLAINNNNIVAIGETGLDYFHLPEKGKEEIIEKQIDFFRRQILLASEQNLPLIIHCRESSPPREPGLREEAAGAYADLIKILKEEKVNRGVVHCFSGILKEARQILDLGLFLGFTGIITFKNAKSLQEIVKKVPLEKILVETDAPYLSPEPHRGERNLPIFVEFVAKKIAELKNLPEEKVFVQTLNNTKQLFNLPPHQSQKRLLSKR